MVDIINRKIDKIKFYSAGNNWIGYSGGTILLSQNMLSTGDSIIENYSTDNIFKITIKKRRKKKKKKNVYISSFLVIIKFFFLSQQIIPERIILSLCLYILSLLSFPIGLITFFFLFFSHSFFYYVFFILTQPIRMKFHSF